jgi:hypothetical protein
MGLKALILAGAVLAGATTMASAQSLPNYGPNAPGNGDSYGKPYSGAQPLRTGPRYKKSRGYRSYAYQGRWHARHSHRHSYSR